MYHHHIKSFCRNDEKYATMTAAYRAAVLIFDERTGQSFDYRKKRGVISAELILPPGVVMSRSELWNAAEKAEKRKNSQVAREVEVSLPYELEQTARRDLAHRYARWLVDRYSVGADVSLHQPVKGKQGDARNFHAHIQITTRRLSAAGLGEKTRELVCAKTSGEAEIMRATWAQFVNEAYQQAGIDKRVDHRSLEAQGIDRMATVHLGPASTAIERRGNTSQRGSINREIHEINEEIQAINALRIEEAQAAAPAASVFSGMPEKAPGSPIETFLLPGPTHYIRRKKMPLCPCLAHRWPMPNPPCPRK